MEYRNLGRSGLKVSQMSLGCNAFGARTDEQTSVAVVHAALAAGINLIDTADMYSKGVSEAYVGKALKDRRSRAVLATKVFSEQGPGPNDRGLSRQHILDAVDASLRRLQTDYIDLYQLHFWDKTAPLEETLRTLDDLVRWGKVRYVGCSNFAAWQIVKALWIQDRNGYDRFISYQPEYSPADRKIEREILPACLAEGLGLITYFPLAGGLFTGKYRPDAPPPPGSRALTASSFSARFLTDANYALTQRLGQIAAAASVSLPQLVLAWNMHQPGVTSAIVGASQPEQVTANVQACEIKLSADVISAIDTATDDRS